MEPRETQSEVTIPGKKRLLEDFDEMDQVPVGKRYKETTRDKASAQGVRFKKTVRFNIPKSTSRRSVAGLCKTKPFFAYDMVDCGIVQQGKSSSFEHKTPAPTADDDDTVRRLKIRDFIDECYQALAKDNANTAGFLKEKSTDQNTMSPTPTCTYEDTKMKTTFKVPTYLPERFRSSKSKETLAQRLRCTRTGLKSAAGRPVRQKISALQKEARETKFNSKRLTMDQLTDEFDIKASQFLQAKLNMIAANKNHGNNNKSKADDCNDNKHKNPLLRSSSLTSIVARFVMSGMTVNEFSKKVQNNTPNKFMLRPSSLTPVVKKLIA